MNRIKERQRQKIKQVKKTGTTRGHTKYTFYKLNPTVITTFNQRKQRNPKEKLNIGEFTNIKERGGLKTGWISISKVFNVKLEIVESKGITKYLKILDIDWQDEVYSRNLNKETKMKMIEGIKNKIEEIYSFETKNTLYELWGEFLSKL